MKPLKKYLSISEQVSLLESRGLIINNKAYASDTLRNLNYYRFTGYLHDFKKPNSDNYQDGITFERIKALYDFDRKLTRILMLALEDIEETLKARLSYVITSENKADPLIYVRPGIYREYPSYLKFLSHFYEAVDNNKNLPFVKHHIKEYGGFLPMWVAVELLTMGNLHALYDNLIGKYQKLLAKTYGTGPRQLENWLKNLTYTRNHLAHYMRVYNFNFGRTPMRCNNTPLPVAPSQMIFDQIFVISRMYSDRREWNNHILPEIESLLDEYDTFVEPSAIGFPVNWKSILS